jgi:hypothetical protein
LADDLEEQVDSALIDGQVPDLIQLSEWCARFHAWLTWRNEEDDCDENLLFVPVALGLIVCEGWAENLAKMSDSSLVSGEVLTA